LPRGRSKPELLMPEPKSPRVLVADDEDAIRTLVVRLLRRAGFQPVEATDGQHAIEQLDAAEFDALVLDLMMPRVDGFGVIDHLIETQPRMMEKTVVMTAFPKTAAKERLHHLCCILSKPFDTEELIQLVRACSER
jgi:CheY-like chemotaxis protein